MMEPRLYIYIYTSRRPFDLSHSVKTKFHYAVQLMTSSRGGRRPASEQDNVVEYGLNRLRSGPSYLDMSR